MSQKANLNSAGKRVGGDRLLSMGSFARGRRMSRDGQYCASLKDLLTQSFGSLSFEEENSTIRYAHYLRSLGLLPDKDESLEGFVSRYSYRLKEEVM